MVMILYPFSGLRDTNHFPDLKNVTDLHDRQDCKTTRLSKIEFFFQMFIT
jgi:hypothetical protein